MTPTIVRRVCRDEDGRDVALEIVSVPHEGTGGEALVVFMNPEQAEAWRVEHDCYPASEGFKVVNVDVDGLKSIFEVWGFEAVALWGPEPDIVSDFGTGEFVAMLESVEPIVTDYP